MAMQTANDLFLHELGDMYDAEQRIEQTLPTLEQEAANDQVRQAFSMHLQQTREHIRNLDQVFQILGTKAPKVTCMAIQGLKQEHDTFVKEGPSQQVLTMFDIGAASKTEHYEIASYQGLIEKARLMGQHQIVQLLEQISSRRRKWPASASSLANSSASRPCRAWARWARARRKPAVKPTHSAAHAARGARPAPSGRREPRRPVARVFQTHNAPWTFGPWRIALSTIPLVDGSTKPRIAVSRRCKPKIGLPARIEVADAMSRAGTTAAHRPRAIGWPVCLVHCAVCPAIAGRASMLQSDRAQSRVINRLTNPRGIWVAKLCGRAASEHIAPQTVGRSGSAYAPD